MLFYALIEIVTRTHSVICFQNGKFWVWQSSVCVPLIENCNLWITFGWWWAKLSSSWLPLCWLWHLSSWKYWETKESPMWQQMQRCNMCPEDNLKRHHSIFLLDKIFNGLKKHDSWVLITFLSYLSLSYNLMWEFVFRNMSNVLWL